MPVCASCGQDNPEIASFCLACGAPLVVVAASREERKVVSVLFADLVGFTARAEQLDPEDLGALLAPYWERVRGELERHGGTVEKFIGDAVMALFGAPVAHEDDPERAVRAALAIRDWILAEQSDLQVRIAVTTGEALVRLGARPLDGEGMASGDVVSTAARLQTAAAPNGILVDDTTYRMTRFTIEYEAAERVWAKGKSAPVAAWAAVEARSRLGIDVPSTYTSPLVGRQRELDELRDALARARHEEAPQLVTLVGVPGIGKSRLVHELSRLVDADPELVRWRQGRSLPYGEGASFWALGEMIKAEAGILETDPVATVEAKLWQTVQEVVEEPAERDWTVARLRPLVGLSVDGAGVEDRRSELFAAWRRFLEDLAARRPTVLIFEDLHWADDELLDFVDHLAEWATGVPLLVIGTARPELLERRPGWGGGKRNAATISLAPLDEADTGRLLAEVLQSSVLPAELQRALLARAGGNPLYAEQYGRMLAEQGAGGELAVPETVQGLIAARLDGLGFDEKALLQDAAVLGKVFWLGAVAAVGGTDRGAAEQLLHLLERKEFVERARRSSVAGETEYAFRHVLIRDVAYSQIPRAARAEKHRFAAEWIATLGRLEDHADLLAHHYLTALELARAAGGDTRQLASTARTVLIEAGDRAVAVNALAGAARFYESALELWDETAADYPLVLYRLARLRHELGQRGPELEQAYRALLAAGEVGKAAEIVTRLAHVTWLGGDRDRAMEYLTQGTKLVADLPPSEAKAYVLANQSRFHMLASQNKPAIEIGAKVLEMADGLGLEALRAHLLCTVGVARATSGELERGVAELQEGIALAARLNSIEGVRGHINLASVFWYLGDPRAARECHDRGLALAREFGSIGGTTFLTAERSVDRYHAGDWDAALDDARAVFRAVETAPHVMETAARWVQAAISIARGNPDDSQADISRMVEIGRGSKDPQSLYPSLACAAEYSLDLGRREEAEALANELLELIANHPEAPGVEEWTVVLAFVLRELGRGDDLRPLVGADNSGRPWVDAAQGILDGDLAAAADALAQLGDLPGEARLRLTAAEELAAAGHRRQADEQLRRALAFYRGVDARWFITRAERLLAATGRASGLSA